MINYTLPKSVVIDKQNHPINHQGDYRMILDVLSALNDDDLFPDEREYCVLNIFYNLNVPDNKEQAVQEVMKFINCGVLEKNDSSSEKKPPIMNWEQDFPIICDDINAKYGIDIRGLEYLHWWTFVSYYKNLGEGQFSTIVSIRSKLQKNKPLDKWEQEFYMNNKDKVNLSGMMFNREEDDFLNYILGSD